MWDGLPARGRRRLAILPISGLPISGPLITALPHLGGVLLPVPWWGLRSHCRPSGLTRLSLLRRGLLSPSSWRGSLREPLLRRAIRCTSLALAALNDLHWDRLPRDLALHGDPNRHRPLLRLVPLVPVLPQRHTLPQAAGHAMAPASQAPVR